MTEISRPDASEEANPFWEDISPNAHEVVAGYFECRTCGDKSETVLGNEKGSLPTVWDADHKSATGHKKFYMWTLRRNTSQVF